ncbi:hypothetical protein K402DRAFT_398393 [Aulographum hederae CBS 113979]|uniref:SCP domain-containing protein n=1 Tax=Aulographum hederae CBS 113979 TaxID=1176131 RepID=A0A6G1GLD6_9PEZI|nr:hypothetical protein K402DRAFT_398393 [Aulographum hederae CBS 113979]
MAMAMASPSPFSLEKRYPILSPPSSGGVSILDTINKYRSKYGLPELEWLPRLALNAKYTGHDAGGKELRHCLFPGTMAQVITPAINDEGVCGRDFKGYTPFEAFYMDFLCEVPTDAALGGKCPTVGDITSINYLGSGVGHHDILVSRDYSKIGCFFTNNPSANPMRPLDRPVGL